jgi:hypothetical protein
MKYQINPEITKEQLQQYFNRRGKRLDRQPMTVGFIKHQMVTAWCPVMQHEFKANSYCQMFEMCFHANDEGDLEDAISLGMVSNV